MTGALSPFKSGPQINLTGLKTTGVKGSITLNDAITIPKNPSHFTLASIGMSQNILGTQLAANVISTKETSDTGKTGRVTTINLNASRDIPRLGKVVLSSIFNTHNIFQITALVSSIPIYNNLMLAFGPGYSTNWLCKSIYGRAEP